MAKFAVIQLHGHLKPSIEYYPTYESADSAAQKACTETDADSLVVQIRSEYKIKKIAEGIHHD